MGKGYIVLTYKYGQEGSRWTACCEELGTATFGRSLPEAEKRLEEAVDLHLDTLNDVGELESFFKKQGITLYHTKPRAVNISMPTDKRILASPHIQAIPQLV